MKEVSTFLLEVVMELYEVLPYFILGVLLEAWIRTKKYHLKIRKALMGYGWAAVIIATVLGLVSPLCACGILPLTISLILGGLPLAPAMALLVSAPLMSPAGYTLSLKNIGPLMANAEVLATLFMGLYAGTIVHLLERRGFNAHDLFKKELPKGDFHDHDYPEEILRCGCNDMFSKKIERAGHGPVAVFFAKAWEGGVKVGKFLIIGIMVGVAAKTLVPYDWIDRLMTSDSPLAALGIAVFAIPMHITQITASAILYGFHDMNVSPSSAMALLIGGPVTAIPVMWMFLTLFKPKVFFVYITICITGTMICAFVFQLLVGKLA